MSSYIICDLLLAAGVGAEKPVQRDVHGAVVAVEVFVVEPGRSSRVSALVCIVTGAHMWK